MIKCYTNSLLLYYYSRNNNSCFRNYNVIHWVYNMHIILTNTHCQKNASEHTKKLNIQIKDVRETECLLLLRSLVTEFIDYFNWLICFCSQHSCICICMLYFLYSIFCVCFTFSLACSFWNLVSLYATILINLLTARLLLISFDSRVEAERRKRKRSKQQNKKNKNRKKKRIKWDPYSQ